MWLIHMIFAEVNNSGHKKGQTLTAQGLIRICEMQVGHARTEAEAKKQCVVLAVRTLKDRGHDHTVIGYGVRNYYASKGAKLSWKMSIQQILRVLTVRKARRDAAVALLKGSHKKVRKAA